MVLAILVLGGIYVARSPGAKAWLSDRVDLVGARLKGRAAHGNPDPTIAASERDIHREINRQRSDHGLAPLRYDDATAAVARPMAFTERVGPLVWWTRSVSYLESVACDSEKVFSRRRLTFEANSGRLNGEDNRLGPVDRRGSPPVTRRAPPRSGRAR